MYVCMSSSYSLSHTPTQSPHWVSFYRFWTTIAITGKKAAQREREWERETLITQTKHLHMHTHSHPLSKLWRNLGLALVFTTKVQWSIAKPKKKLMRECVWERANKESAAITAYAARQGALSCVVQNSRVPCRNVYAQADRERVGEKEWEGGRGNNEIVGWTVGSVNAFCCFLFIVQLLRLCGRNSSYYCTMHTQICARMYVWECVRVCVIIL